ncbi:MAG: MmcQ/YjbR family DNA-binding protein [Flavobacteriales bacterium]|nr:MmcQ/YjbR family DNA-binding protein [Flavobacteriales bacterium]
MNIEEFREFCLSLSNVSEHFPFDDRTLVFKVGGKMFALADIEDFVGVNLKCDPEKAIQLREEYTEVQPGYHMSKKHWNTVSVVGGLDDELIYSWIKTSYDLVFDSLPNKIKNVINEKRDSIN